METFFQQLKSDNIQLNNYVYQNDIYVYHVMMMKDEKSLIVSDLLENFELFVMKLYLNVNLELMQLLVDKKNKNEYQLSVMELGN